MPSWHGLAPVPPQVAERPPPKIVTKRGVVWRVALLLLIATVAVWMPVTRMVGDMTNAPAAVRMRRNAPADAQCPACAPCVGGSAVGEGQGGDGEHAADAEPETPAASTPMPTPTPPPATDTPVTPDAAMCGFVPQYERGYEVVDSDGPGFVEHTPGDGNLPLTTMRCVTHESSWDPTLRDGGQASCVFENLYYQHPNWLFVTSGEGSPEAEQFRTMPMLLMRSRSKNNPQVRRGHEIREAVATQFNGDIQYLNRTLVVHERFDVSSHGHALIDGVLPVHAAMDTLGVYTPNCVPVAIDKWARTTYDDRYELICKHKLMTRGTVCESGKVCHFYRVVFGIGGLGFWFRANQYALRDRMHRGVRDAAWRYSRFGPPNSKPPVRDDMRVLVVQRARTRQVLNRDEVVQWLGDFLRPRYPGVTVELVMLEHKTLAEQVDMQRDVSIYVSVDGSAIDNTIMAPDGSGLLVFEPVNTWDNHRYHYDVWERYHAIARAPWFPEGGQGRVHKEDVLAALTRVLCRMEEMHNARLLATA